MIKKMLVIPHFWVLAVMLSIQVCNAAEITKERGVNGLPDVIRIAGQFNLGDQDKFQALGVTFTWRISSHPTDSRSSSSVMLMGANSQVPNLVGTTFDIAPRQSVGRVMRK